jgi:predicted Zn-dependent protease
MMATTLAAGTMADAGMESYFHAIADELERAIRAGEQYTAWLDAEVTDFVRMNGGKVRQPGSVTQRYLSVRLIAGARHAEHTLSLTGDVVEDARSVTNALASLRAALPELADDPHLLLPAEVVSSRDEHGGGLPPSEHVIDGVLDAAEGLDLVGLYAAGPVYRGFANSLGQRNWHVATTFNLQWSLYHRADKAVKSAYAGFTWDDAAFGAKMAQAREQLAMLARPAKVLAPGRYRAFLTPAAMEEIAGLLHWGAFSGRSLATKQSPLSRMASGERFDPRVNVAEDLSAGVAPRFQGDGFARPARVPLIDSGELVGSLVSPRTAREFGLATNGANGQESPESFAMAGGDLRADDALAALDTGLLIGNLWYLNYSDAPACRVTGMTRFATFWVEGGRIVAPVDVLRFDDSLYRILGNKLEALTDTPELILSADSYRSRSLSSTTLPGALVAEIEFTL